ncbi:hypothetical protein [Lacinutrix sp.]|uniref:hypothetical protein n=1 Tax=Lacinutrix sp. TaxID=1937692 RepID=UPI0025C20ED6|nr:hypothetical protein [Lacinutrix sp.]
MDEKLITVKQVSLNNNCPECFSKKGLELAFKQNFIETKFYRSITQDISTEMYCNICDSNIYPINWTEDIERVYDYQMKAFEPKKASKKYKPLFWIITGVVATVVITGAVLALINFPV